MSQQNGISVDAAPEAAQAEPKGALAYLKKLWVYRKYLVIEPFFFFYLMASIFNAVAMQNFPLDKACRVNLGYSKLVCDTTLDKSELGIECEGFSFDNTTLGATAQDATLTISSVGFNYTVCKAEVEAQKLAADVSGKRAPIGLLISAIFFDSLPMEFGAYCEAIVPALFGGLTFCLMAVYSYITIATPEEDRIFRFGIFAMFVTAVPFIGQPISGFLFQQLGYIFSFGMAASF
ncbi:PREDICTED: uncharacterized protein LOC108377872, partial [Rhagoletis zephyria]|uniref:uncharacterized protein LOC108377872 n=1 Tax=Rhagoletis zephyria TaxID=28612 RepID=UPI000811246B